MSDHLIDIARVVARTRDLVAAVRRCYMQQGEGAAFVYTKEKSLSGGLGHAEVQRAAHELDIALNPSNRATAEGDILRLSKIRRDVCTQLARIWERLEKWFPFEGTYFKHEVDSSVLVEMEAAADYLASTVTEQAPATLKARRPRQSAGSSGETNARGSEWTSDEEHKVPATSAFPHGPLTGTKKRLAQAICPEFTQASDVRNLPKLATKGHIHLHGSGKTWTVYFRDKAVYARANARMMALSDTNDAH